MWKKEGPLYIFTGDQRSEEWFLARKNRVTASRISASIGDSPFSTVEKVAQVIRGEYREETNPHMVRGTKFEDMIRKFYEEEKDIIVNEIGFVFHEDLPYIGVSPDGVVDEDGLIEIKCPENIYEPLNIIIEEGKRRYDRWGKPLHIFNSHYDQMISQMAIMGRKWCDYVVYGLNDEQLYIERIKYNEKYWNYFLLPQIKKFIRQHLKGTSPYIPTLE